MPNIANFTRAMLALDTPDVYIDCASIEDIKMPKKHTSSFVQTVEYTEMSEIDKTTHIHKVSVKLQSTILL